MFILSLIVLFTILKPIFALLNKCTHIWSTVMCKTSMQVIWGESNCCYTCACIHASVATKALFLYHISQTQYVFVFLQWEDTVCTIVITSIASLVLTSSSLADLFKPGGSHSPLSERYLKMFRGNLSSYKECGRAHNTGVVEIVQ